ncbi:hypothetical protein GWK47_019231 [Chionoecetes opilio]|uniref:Uncharacterized protein n=1 Tax=Chionoecetes opilio TaxID=41210 RepID=A0A8J4XU95_CHIOP|nr:hypothetical protein GWK47_019231 [Chionoecetes opilio]
MRWWMMCCIELGGIGEDLVYSWLDWVLWILCLPSSGMGRLRHLQHVRSSHLSKINKPDQILPFLVTDKLGPIPPCMASCGGGVWRWALVSPFTAVLYVG